MYTKCRKRDH